MATADTRQLLIDAATREFAERGVDNASLLEITRQAGQRNRGAVHYHFGSREGMLVAVLEQQVDFLAPREHELLEAARARPADDVRSVVEAVVRPVVELAEIGGRGRCYLMVLAQLVDMHPLPQAIVDVMARTGGYEIFALLAERLPEMPEPLLLERQALMLSFVLNSVASRARGVEQQDGRPQLPTDVFTENLMNMATAMVTAPLP